MEISNKVIKSPYKLMSVNEFRFEYGAGVTPQAISYACSKDKLDYLKISDSLKVIVLTEKSKSYKPNKSKKRSTLKI